MLIQQNIKAGFIRIIYCIPEFFYQNLGIFDTFNRERMAFIFLYSK